MFSNFSLTFSPITNNAYIILFAILFLSVSLLFYHKNKLKIIFIFQFLLLALILLFLVKPVLIKKTGVFRHPQLNVIIDDSESMLINRYNDKPLIQYANALSESIKNNYKGEIKKYSLAEFEKKFSDGLANPKNETVNSKNLIISDFNFQLNDFFDIENSLFAHTAADTITNYITLRNVSFDRAENNYMFNISAAVFTPAEYIIKITDIKTNKILISKAISVSQNGEYIWQIPYLRNTKTLQFLKFEITASLKNENILIDNEYILVLDDESKKNTILLINNTPDWDFAFFNRHLNSLKSIEIDYYYQTLTDINAPLNFYEKKYDLIILFKPDYPALPAYFKKIIAEKYKNILYFTGADKRKIATELLNRLNCKVSATATPVTDRFVNAMPAIDSFIMPYIDWNLLPPLEKILDITMPENSNIRISSIPDSLPVLTEIKNNEEYALLVTASGFYKWDFFSGLNNNEYTLFKELWTSIIDYMLTKNTTDEITIKTNPTGNHFYRFDNIEYRIISPANMQNMKGAKTIHLFNYGDSIVLNDSISDLPANELGLNTIVHQYRENKKSVNFDYYIDYRLQEKNIFSIENIKNAISNKKNYFNLTSSGELTENINSIIKPVEKTLMIELTNNIYFLIFLILFFSINWYLLKKQN